MVASFLVMPSPLEVPAARGPSAAPAPAEAAAAGGVSAEAVPTERGRRAAPMSPEDRRDAIVGAVIPLLRERGAAVTTRELADAAGVAEGTLFRVFPDKAALVRAAVERALDPTPVLDHLAGVEVDLPIRIKLAKVTAILQEHAGSAASLVAVSHELFAGARAEDAGSAHGSRPGPDAVHGHGPGHGLWAHHPVNAVVRAVAAVLDHHAEQLRLEPMVCARLLVGLVLTTNRPLGGGRTPALGPHQLAALFCDGAVRPTTSEDHPC